MARRLLSIAKAKLKIRSNQASWRGLTRCNRLAAHLAAPAASPPQQQRRQQFTAALEHK